MRHFLPPMVAVGLLGACSAAPADNELGAAQTTTPSNELGNDVYGGNVAAPAIPEGEDAKVAGTDYDAVADIPCGLDQEIDASCSAGVKRSSGTDGTSFVEVTRPDGSKRILFFQGNKASGADANEADGSSKYRFLWHREEDWVVIRYGPERYRVPDALIVGD